MLKCSLICSVNNLVFRGRRGSIVIFFTMDGGFHISINLTDIVPV